MPSKQPEPVTSDDLVALPRWAIVAFAARCARRVQPLFDLPKDHPNRWQYIRDVNGAIDACERFVVRTLAGIERVDQDSHYCNAVYARLAAQAVAEAADEITDVTIAYADYANSAFLAVSAAEAAAHSYEACSIASRNSNGHRDSDYETAIRAAEAADNSYVDGVAHAAARTDLVRLQVLTVSTSPNSWDSSNFGHMGPLWPKGPPDWYPAAKERMDRLLAQARKELAKAPPPTKPDPAPTITADAAALPISLYFDLEEFTPEQIEEQIAALSDLYHAISDDELQIVGRTFLSPSLVPVED